MKNLKGIGDFVDDTLGSFMAGWGCFTVIFFVCTPIIFVLAFIKWLVINGHI